MAKTPQNRNSENEGEARKSKKEEDRSPSPGAATSLSAMWITRPESTSEGLERVKRVFETW